MNLVKAAAYAARSSGLELYHFLNAALLPTVRVSF